MALKQRPYNAHQLSETLNLNYKTVRHHIKVLEENDVITSAGKKKYGEMYFLTPSMEISMVKGKIHDFSRIRALWGRGNFRGSGHWNCKCLPFRRIIVFLLEYIPSG